MSRRHRPLLVVVVGGAAMGLALSVSAPASADWQSGGVSWNYFEEGSGYYREPEGGEEPSPSGPPTVMVEYADLDGTVHCVPSDDRICSDSGGEASRWCSPTDMETNRPRFAFMRYTREIDEEDGPGPWELEPEEGFAGFCYVTPDDDWVSQEEISWTVDEEVFQPLGDPGIAVDPGDRAIVNLPTLVSTDYPQSIEPPGEIVSQDPPTVRIPVNIERPGENLTGEIVVTADYTWTFEGGRTASGQGNPYTPRVDPRNDSGYYVSEVFTTTGTKTIDLDVVWTGEVTVDGLDPEPIEPVERNATASIDVVELGSVLTDR